MKNLASTIKTKWDTLQAKEREQGMELIQFTFVLAICIVVGTLVFTTLQGSFQPGLAYISHLSDGAFTTNDSGNADFDMYM